MTSPVTIIIIIITCIISFMAFSNHELFARLQFNAYQVYHRKQLYRLITHGFVHANWIHLIINMLVFYSFGSEVEKKIYQEVNKYPELIYIMFYLAALIFSSTISLVKQKDNAWYNAVGASGAVSAALFFFIFFEPWHPLQLYFFIPVPGIVFGVLYLIYSQYMSKRGNDNIAHEAHFLGAVLGFVFPLFLNPDNFLIFLSKLFFLS